MVRTRTGRLHLPVLCLAVCAGIALAGCKDEGTVKVKSIDFKGIHAFKPAELETVLATKASGWLPWSKKRYFDPAEFEADLDRIAQFYRDNGYPEARVVSFDVKANDTGDEVRVELTIDEGQPIIVEDVKLEGFEVLPRRAFNHLRTNIQVRPGQVRRQAQIAASRDMAARSLQDNGFAYAKVTSNEETGSRVGHIVWTLKAEPGPKSTFGTIQINGNKQVGDDVIGRELSVREGQLFRLRALYESQRRLYSRDLFQYANLEPLLSPNQDPEVPIRVTISEAKAREFRGSIGYGSEEKVRAEVGWGHKNFLGGARTVDFDARWSSLDRGVKAQFNEPYFLGARQGLTVTGQSWYTNEPAYTLRTTGGRVTYTKDRTAVDPVRTRHASTQFSVALIHEFESYTIDEDFRSDPTLWDELIALGLNPLTGEGRGTLSGIAVDVRRDTTRNLLNARNGYVVAGHLEQAATWLAGDYRYLELTGEGRHYLQVGPRLVFANRVRVGSISDRGNVTNVPFFKRYFLGGATSLRGWGRFEVAPLTPSGLPVGGFSFLEASSELRMAAFGKVGLVAFVDAGNVWGKASGFDLGDLRFDAGPGIRYDTPVGPLRFDIGYQLNPIEGLLVNGKPQSRRWRMHFSIGHAF